MSTNRPGYIREYYHRIRADLLKQFGGECQCRTCHETENLEFAHRAFNGLNGRGRGRAARYRNIRKHPEDYILLCHKHHVEMDNELFIGEKEKPEYTPYEEDVDGYEDVIIG